MKRGEVPIGRRLEDVGHCHAQLVLATELVPDGSGRAVEVHTRPLSSAPTLRVHFLVQSKKIELPTSGKQQSEPVNCVQRDSNRAPVPCLTQNGHTGWSMEATSSSKDGNFPDTRVQPLQH